MKQTKFLSIIFLLLIVTISGFIFNKYNNNQLLKNKLDCKISADKYTKIIKNELDQDTLDDLFSEPKFVFSEDLNTCLYLKIIESFWSDGTKNWITREIVDIYTNTTVVEYSEHFDKSGIVNNAIGNKKEYDNLYKKYFNDNIEK